MVEGWNIHLRVDWYATDDKKHIVLEARDPQCPSNLNSATLYEKGFL